MAAWDHQSPAVFGGEVGKRRHDLHAPLASVGRVSPKERIVVAMERLLTFAWSDLDHLRRPDPDVSAERPALVAGPDFHRFRHEMLGHGKI